MGIFIFTKREYVLKPFFPKDTVFLPLTITKHSPEAQDISYIDVFGFSAIEIKKAITRLKKFCGAAPWGIIDSKRSVWDPAELFFDGASDYLGSEFFKEDIIEPKRIKAASQWHSMFTGSEAEAVKKKTQSSTKNVAAGSSAQKSEKLLKTKIKIAPASLFPGWTNMQTGKIMPFYLMYCALHGKTALNARLGEKGYGYLQQRLLTYLFQNFRDSDGLIWMDSGKDFLFLLPPRLKNAEHAIQACIRMLASVPLITMEIFGLSIPVNFVFTLHYGSISYSPPGKTGTVVSDAVNFIFHLGNKKSEPGRLTISDEIPNGSIPKVLEDCFVPAGDYEGREIWHTKKFSYIKPWW